MENAGVEKATVDRKGGKCRRKLYGTPNRDYMSNYQLMRILFSILTFFHKFSLRYFPLLHFPLLQSTPAFSTPAFSTRAFSAPPW